LVVFQFTIATFLIISLLFVSRQIHFLKNKDLGFAEEQVMVMRGLTDQMQDSYKAIHQELADLSGVQQVVLNQQKGRIIGVMDDSYIRSFLLRVNTDNVPTILCSGITSNPHSAI